MTSQDLGTADMFCDSSRVGAFAVRPKLLAASDRDALFKVLIATTLFQRLQDRLVLKILQGMKATRVAEITDAVGLLVQADACPCACLRSNTALVTRCDLTKDPVTGLGVCGISPRVECPLKRHTVWLKRYGHFGKVPTSAALMLREAGVDDLCALERQVVAAYRTRDARTAAMGQALRRIWRVNDKISAMFLSAMAATGLSRANGPWRRDLAGDRLVVIDSNVDAFLTRVRYRGQTTYSARRDFLLALARAVNLRKLHPTLHRFNPRLLQQGLYAFMSKVNRGDDPADCTNVDGSCGRCPGTLSAICPVRRPALRGYGRPGRRRTTSVPGSIS